MNKYCKSGFTLIELLFVIAIIGVIASIGLALTQQQAQKTKIEKAALQMQQILQSGLTYYAVKNNWPEDCIVSGAGGCCSAKPKPLFCDYIPVSPVSGSADPISPYGNQYYWLKKPLSDTPSAAKFRVCIKDLSSATALRIAALLPNAAARSNDCNSLASCASSSTPCAVISEVSQSSGGGGGGGSGNIVAEGVCPDPNTAICHAKTASADSYTDDDFKSDPIGQLDNPPVISYKCPAGQHGHMLMLLDTLESGTPQCNDAQSIRGVYMRPTCTDTACTANFTFTSACTKNIYKGTLSNGGLPGRVRFSYVIYCR